MPKETNQVISYKLFNPTYFSMFRLPYLDDNTCILFNTNLKKVSEEVRRDFKAYFELCNHSDCTMINAIKCHF